MYTLSLTRQESPHMTQKIVQMDRCVYIKAFFSTSSLFLPRLLERLTATMRTKAANTNRWLIFLVFFLFCFCFENEGQQSKVREKLTTESQSSRQDADGGSNSVFEAVLAWCHVAVAQLRARANVYWWLEK